MAGVASRSYRRTRGADQEGRLDRIPAKISGSGRHYLTFCEYWPRGMPEH